MWTTELPTETGYYFIDRHGSIEIVGVEIGDKNLFIRRFDEWFAQSLENLKVKRWHKIEEPSIDKCEKTQITIPLDEFSHLTLKANSQESTIRDLNRRIEELEAEKTQLREKNEALEQLESDFQTNFDYKNDLIADYEERIARLERLLGRYFERDEKRREENLSEVRETFEETLRDSRHSCDADEHF